jgi:molybdate transport system substrate-binding protein
MGVVRMFLDRRAVLAGLVALALWAGPPRAQADEQADVPVVAVASSLRFAMADVARAFTDDTGLVVKFSFGSSGNLSRQIREGAPFQMFLAADEQFILDLHDDGLTPDAGDVYAVGRIVIVAPNGSPLTPDANMDALAALLAAGRITRFAIANPDHAPYGMRAREALIARGLWDDLQPALILGENVSQAAQFALSGNAEGGIIAYALALAPEVAPRGHYALIPEDWHTPLRQRMVLLNGAGDVARAFYAYLNAPAARAILSRYGFTVPTGG